MRQGLSEDEAGAVRLSSALQLSSLIFLTQTFASLQPPPGFASQPECINISETNQTGPRLLA